MFDLQHMQNTRLENQKPTLLARISSRSHLDFLARSGRAPRLIHRALDGPGRREGVIEYGFGGEGEGPTNEGPISLMANKFERFTTVSAA